MQLRRCISEYTYSFSISCTLQQQNLIKAKRKCDLSTIIQANKYVLDCNVIYHVFHAILIECPGFL